MDQGSHTGTRCGLVRPQRYCKWLRRMYLCPFKVEFEYFKMMHDRATYKRMWCPRWAICVVSADGDMFRMSAMVGHYCFFSFRCFWQGRQGRFGFVNMTLGSVLRQLWKVFVFQ